MTAGPTPSPPNGRAARADPTARPLPDRLITALQRAHTAEQVAVGEQRRPAFRLTRALLGGARRAGYAPTLLAQTLGISIHAVRGRGGGDGWISRQVFTDLTDLPPGVIDSWATAGLLPARALDEIGRDCYLASELIRALGRQSANRTSIPKRTRTDYDASTAADAS